MNKNGFITDNFLLQNDFAEELYHKYAKKQPIIDYHNHLPPQEIALDKVYDNISQVWIAGDHYKWRAMRTLGINEKNITGDSTDREKFMAWARVVPDTLRNPLYHWTHLELKRYFNIDNLLNENSAAVIYENINAQLQQTENSCRGLISQMNVKVICTTEDPTDDLKYHKQMGAENIGVKVSTAFRPDKAVVIEDADYLKYLESLSNSADMSISTFQQLKDALIKRMDYFDDQGCKLCDHGLSAIPFEKFNDAEIEVIFEKRIHNIEITQQEARQYKTAILLFLGENYHSRDWVQQFHLGALRNNNKRMLAKLGPDTGWDSIGDYAQAETLSAFLNALDSRDNLPKTILYNLNPADNAIFATMVGNFNDGSTKGKVQWGSGWWFLDQKDGMENQLNTLSNMGIISCFIGMLTDSRSFLSFPRHEYFRRVLCNLFGKEIASGELPNDMELIGKTISNICYNNADEYFNFK
ncbi:MAG: glucuronate isomerase [Leeuwenhoekiella sp.]